MNDKRMRHDKPSRAAQDLLALFMSRTLENNIGRDLQFIRINGTLVGALVGLLLHALAQVVLGWVG